MIGQERLLKKLNEYTTLAELPKTLLFVAEAGAGKKLVARDLAHRLGLDIVEFDSSVTSEDLIKFQQCPVYTLYIINLSTFTERDQNKLLKFIEEPATSVYSVLTAETEIGILPTILNRCIKYYFEQYTPDQLKQLNWVSASYPDLVYKVCRTPGKLLDVDVTAITKLYDLCLTIVTKIDKATYVNTLSIATKINYKEEYNKFDFNLFFDMLLYVAQDVYIKSNSNLALKIYLFTTDYLKQYIIGNSLAKENFMLSYFTALWENTRS